MAVTPGVIVTERLRLAPLTVEDADEMSTVLGDARMYEFTGGGPPSLDQLRERYRRLVVGHSADGSQQWLNWIVRLAADDVAVGVMQATVEADGSSADVAWEVGVPWQGRGIASEAARAVVEWLVGQGVGTITACIHPEHHASGRVAGAGRAVTDGGARRRRDDVAPDGPPSGRRPGPSPEDRRCVSNPGASFDPSFAASSRRRSATASGANSCAANSRASSGAIGPPCRRNVWTDAAERRAA